MLSGRTRPFEGISGKSSRARGEHTGCLWNLNLGPTLGSDLESLEGGKFKGGESMEKLYQACKR